MKQKLTIEQIRKINDESDQLLYEIARQETRLLAPEILLAALKMYYDHITASTTAQTNTTTQTSENTEINLLNPPYEITPERGSEIIRKCQIIWQEHHKKSLKQLNRLKKFRNWTRQFTRSERYIALMLLENGWGRHNTRLDGKKEIRFKGLEKKEWLAKCDEWEREHITTLGVDARS